MSLDPEALADLAMIAQYGSISAAARARRVAVSTATRRLDALEQASGLRLVDRGARGATLTSAGRTLAGLSEPLAEQLARIERAAAAMRSGAREAPIRVSATEFVISDVLAPALPALLASQPGLGLQLTSEAAVVSLAGRQADLALRMARPEGASLVARRIAEVPLGLFAAASYLGGRDPAALDLAREVLLGYDDSYGAIPETQWFASRKLGERMALRTSSTRALMIAAAGGAGIALLPRWFAAENGLVEIPLPDSIPARPVWLIVHRDLRRDPQIRAVWRWIERAFADQFRRAASATRSE